MYTLFPNDYLQFPHYIDQALHSFYHGKNVLVTGGTGFIGTYLIEKLCTLGATVTVIDDFSNSSTAHNPALFASIVIIHNSIIDDVALDHLFTHTTFDLVFHLAALRSVTESFEKPDLYHTINTQGTLKLLKNCQKFNVKRFIFASSAAVYGNYQGICNEDMTCTPISPYGLSKYNAEKYCIFFAQQYNVNTVCLRYFNVYDDLQHNPIISPSVHSTFYLAFKNKSPITIQGTGNQIRDFVPLSFVINANLLFGMLSPYVAGHIFNIATGKSISVNTLLTCLMKQYNISYTTVFYQPERIGDIPISQASVQKYHHFIHSLSIDRLKQLTPKS